MRGRKEAASNFLRRFMARRVLYTYWQYIISRGFCEYNGGSPLSHSSFLPHPFSFSLPSLFLIKLKIKSQAQARARAYPRSLARSLARAAIFRRICNLYLCIGDSFARFKFDGFFLFGRFNYSNTA